MNQNPLENWDALSESAKAFAEAFMGKDQTDLFHNGLLSYSQLQIENKQLQAEVASLKETLPYKDKYGNLQAEFRKIAAERDSLSSQVLKLNHITAEYDRMKSAYQETQGKLAALQEKMEDSKSSISKWTALEVIYQAFKTSCERTGRDIRRIPTEVHLQFILQNQERTTVNLSFKRMSKDKWFQL
jgi:chromosome segregation ATPase